MIIAPVANKAGHVHKRLLREDLAVVPASDLHGRGLVANLLDLLDIAAPAGEEFVRILAETKGIPEAVELADFVEHGDDFMAVVVERDGCCAPAQAGADDDDLE
jgi:hypothetical protein